MLNIPIWATVKSDSLCHNIMSFPHPTKMQLNKKKTSRGGGLCAVFSGCIDQFKNLCKGEGLKFVFKFKSMIPEIGGHLPAEGSGLSVPAPRRVQIFFQVCCEVPLEIHAQVT